MPLCLPTGSMLELTLEPSLSGDVSRLKICSIKMTNPKCTRPFLHGYHVSCTLPWKLKHLTLEKSNASCTVPQALCVGGHKSIKVTPITVAPCPSTTYKYLFRLGLSSHLGQNTSTATGVKQGIKCPYVYVSASSSSSSDPSTPPSSRSPSSPPPTSSLEGSS
jgi:hypothetical protein